MAGSPSHRTTCPAQRLRRCEVFVPLRHNPGHAQLDFGEALAEITGAERKIHFFYDGPAVQRRLFCALMFVNPT